MLEKCLLLSLLLFGGLALSSCQRNEDIGDDGTIYVNEAWGLRPGGNMMQIMSSRYPQQAPGKLKQTWRYVTFDGSALRLRCYSIDLPAGPGGACKDHILTVVDGQQKSDFCGNVRFMSILSTTNEINMVLKTGPQGGGIVNCSIQAVLMGPYGEVTEPPTERPTPRPTQGPEYLESVEVDSSEFGGPKGTKSTSCSCGWANKVNSRIIGGKFTEVFEYPFMVGLTYQSATGPFCGASIISPYHALTAAHCVVGKSNLQIFAGKHNYNSETNETQVIHVKEIIMHEEYLSRKPNFDIALLVLDKKVEYNQNVGPVCIPSRQLKLDDQYVTTIGWGMTAPVGPSSPVLKKVHMRVLPYSKCARKLNLDTSAPHQICTYSKLKGFGRGDSGGPVVWLNPETNRYTLVGLPSYVFLYEGQRHYLPDVAADVSSFTHWIIEKIRDSRTGGYPCWALD